MEKDLGLAGGGGLVADISQGHFTCKALLSAGEKGVSSCRGPTGIGVKMITLQGV